MKRCPQCNRIESDDSLAFCRVDGSPLAEVSGEVETSLLPHAVTDPGSVRSTGPTTVLPASDAQSSTRQLEAQSNRKHVASPRNSLIAGAIGILVVTALGVGSYWKYGRSEKQISSIAVMPFLNESGNPDVEYLSDGITETLIKSLSRVPNLAVKSRSTVFHYKGKEISPKMLGEELNVQTVLLGRFGGRGEDLKLSLELVNTQTQDVIWAEQYDRRRSDLVSLQSEIAKDVSTNLKSKLSGADEAKVTRTYTTNPDAYQLYLKGKYYQSKYNEDNYRKAIDHYQQAIDLDPNYALAYLGMAEVYNNASDWYLPPNVAMPKAKAAVLKAIELDNTLAQAHHELGILIFWYDRDWAAAEREMERAIELDANYTMYGLYLAALGKHEAAIRAQEMTNRRSPLDLQFGMDLSGIYLAAGRLEQSIEQSRKTIELDPNYWGGYQELGLALLRNKQFPEAITAMEKSRSLDNNPSVSGYLGFAYATAGKKAEAQRVLDELKELSKKQYAPAYSIAIIYAGLNEKDQAFEWLNKAFADRSFYIALLNFESTLDNLRPDPRFNDLLRRANLAVL